MKVLVTGGGGFLGSAIVGRLAARGHEVRVLGRHDYPALRAVASEQIRADVADPAAVLRAAEGCAAVVHSAALVGSWGRASEYERINVRGTQNVIDACQRQGLSKLVFTSTPSVVHSGSDIEGGDESLPIARHFDAHYPRTKAIAERLVLQANGAHLATLALRPHLVIGPGDTQLLPRAVASARARKLWLPSGPQKLIDWTYIDDAAEAHALALERLAPGKACAGRAYFISQGVPVALSEIVTRVLHAAGVQAVPRRIAPWILQVAGAVGELLFAAARTYDREPPITRFVANQLSTAHWFDISAARRDLGYCPSVSLEVALARIAESFPAEPAHPSQSGRDFLGSRATRTVQAPRQL